MKRVILVVCMLFAISPFASAQKYFVKAKVSSSTDSVSYALGYYLAQNLIKQGLTEYDATLIGKGFADAKDNASPSIPASEIQDVLENHFAQIEEAKKNAQLQKEKEFLEKNAKEEGVITLESGLQYKVIKEGTGKTPSDTDMVKIHYEGKLLDGSVFDSSFDNEEPAELSMEYLTPGLIEGLKLMKEGAEYIFYVPSELGYGEYSQGDVLPAYSTLIFDIELISTEPRPAQDETELDSPDFRF